jgi:hypothetical protein
MRRTSASALAVAFFLAGLALPVAVVSAQTPPDGTPTAEDHCTKDKVDPTQPENGNIQFVRLSGPPAGAAEGPSLYRVVFGQPDSWYFGGCYLEPVAIYVSGGPIYLKAYSGTTDIYYTGNTLPSPDCKAIPENEKPKHETRNMCELLPNGKPALLNTGDGVFHDGEATYEYATKDTLLSLNTETNLANALAAGALKRRANTSVRYQGGGDQSIDIASKGPRPYGCTGDCR